MGQEPKLEETINSVIQDSLYYDYQISHLQFLQRLTSNEFNMQEVGQAIKDNKAPDCENIKSIDPKLPSNVSDYFRAKCESKALFDQLRDKYPDIFGNVELAQKTLERFSKTNERFILQYDLMINNQLTNPD